MALNECGLQAAGTNRVSIRYIKEANNCWGVTPATGNTREARITKSTLAATKTTTVSAELRADRMVSDVVEVAAMSGGDLDAEFAAGSLDDFMEAFLLGTWTRSMGFDKFEGASVHWTANNTVKIAGVDVSGYFVVDQVIKTEGFINPLNNGYNTIATVTYSAPDTIITVDGTPGAVEVGSSFTKVMDANDVIVIRDIEIRAGSNPNQFDSDGANSFATAITAGQLVVGMKIYVAGMGYESGTIVVEGTEETGTVTFSITAVDGDTVTVNDGFNTTVFTFHVAGDGLTGAAVGVAYGASAADSAQNLKAAINTNTHISVSAAGGGAALTLTNKNYVHGSIAASVATAVTFSGLDAGPLDGDTIHISDGLNTVIFEWDNNSQFTRGHVGVTIGASGALSAANLQAAIMASLWQKLFSVKASVATATVTVTNIRDGAGGSMSTTSGEEVVVTNFSGFVANVAGFFTLTAVANDVLTVAETVGVFDGADLVEVTIKGSHLRNPGVLDDIIPQSFTIEQGFTDVSQYEVFTGQRVGDFSLALTAGAIVTSVVKFQGKETSTAQVSLLGNSPYNVKNTTATPVMNATVNVGNIYKNGAVLASALQKIDLSGSSKLRHQMAVSSKFPAGIGTGRFDLTGKMTAYFDTLELFDNFINHDTIALAFNFLDNDHNSYWFSMPAVKITANPLAIAGIDQDVLEEMSFVAFRDATLNTMFMVDRFSSVLPV